MMPGTYRYKTGGDIFSGSWEHGKKVGQGLYQFGADDSIMEGTWLNGTITEGTWVSQHSTNHQLATLYSEITFQL
jgi:hypothetical protein